ncbi:Protein of unknown function [Gryllus bimaculatus]|nr:Protein of unknown function [Gryllus bimaculatus]
METALRDAARPGPPSAANQKAAAGRGRHRRDCRWADPPRPRPRPRATICMPCKLNFQPIHPKMVKCAPPDTE